MEVAVFQTPYMPQSQRSPREIFNWAVDQAVVADQAGFQSYWIGEHALEDWESIPNPELIIAAAARVTDKIKLAPGAHILPLHSPGPLAIQASWLSHVCEGRYIMGAGAGAFPATFAVSGFKSLEGNHEMELEALDIMEKIWAGEEFDYQGKYFKASLPPEDPNHPYRDVRPYGGSIEIGVTGISPNSASMKLAGQRGYLPLSVYAGLNTLQNHWDTYETEMTAAGRIADRSVHHVVRDVLVADTDKEARKLAIEGGMGHAWGEYVLPRYKHYNLLPGLIEDGTDPADVDIEWLADNVWFVGSVETVTQKILDFQERSGGFGVLMPQSFDYSENPEPWNYSMNLLGKEVAPLVTSKLNERSLTAVR